MQVHYSEGIATYTHPEPYGVTREGGGEASVGERVGQLLSRESHASSSADTLSLAYGDMGGCVIARTRTTRRQAALQALIRRATNIDQGDLAYDYRQIIPADPMADNPFGSLRAARTA